MNNKAKIPVILLCLISAFSLFSQKVSFPLKWHAEAYWCRVNPKDSDHFIDGMLRSGVRLIELDNPNIWMTAEVSKWTMMGYVAEDIIFDPVNSHYSLVSRIGYTDWGHDIWVDWVHDCFHEIDKKVEPTYIWNSWELNIAPSSHYNENMRKSMRERRKDRLFYIDPVFDYRAIFGILPHNEDIDWLQKNHKLNYKFAGDFTFSPCAIGNVRFELSYHPLVYIHTSEDSQHSTSANHYIETALNYHSAHSSMSLYLGYHASDDTPIRPFDKRTRLGFYWRM
jgi:hypothetical protein